VLRRVNETDPVAKNEKVLDFGELLIDPNTRDVVVHGTPVSLTVREFDLLYYLATHPNRVFTRDQLMDAVWGYTFAADTSTVTVHMRRLREKIERDPTQPYYLLTVWGVGYRWGGER
jgi:DNA-binding response OmpR family regulator